MVRKVLYPVVFVLAVLMAGPAVAGWDFYTCKTATVSDGLEVLIYDSDGVTPVATGSLVQVVIGLEGAAIVDPLEHFDTDISGVLEGAELAAMTAWINAGADPAAISGGTNVLATASNFTGEGAFSSPGAFNINALQETGNAYDIAPGSWFDKIAYRAWNVSKTQMEEFCTIPEQEIWYLTGREIGTLTDPNGGPDTGWWIGQPGDGLPHPPSDWGGFNGLVAYELSLMGGWRDQYQLETLLGTCPIPEPGTMLLIGGSVVLLLIRRKK